MRLSLLDWRRRTAALYADVRAAIDPITAHDLWTATRADLFAHHPQSPRPGHRPAYYPYDPAWRFVLSVEAAAAQRLEIESGTGEEFILDRVGAVSIDAESLDVHWIEVYGGGVFLPVADGTSGDTTYGGGRYVLDTVKGADLGGDGDTLVVDFNFAYFPSCAYDSRWSCPLAPPGNRIKARIEAGERLPPP
jgi:uncharacterized protein